MANGREVNIAAFFGRYAELVEVIKKSDTEMLVFDSPVNSGSITTSEYLQRR
jgi:hypothetical protein